MKNKFNVIITILIVSIWTFSITNASNEFEIDNDMIIELQTMIDNDINEVNEINDIIYEFENSEMDNALYDNYNKTSNEIKIDNINNKNNITKLEKIDNNYWVKELWKWKLEIIWEYKKPWIVFISDMYDKYIKIKTINENKMNEWDKIKLIVSWTLKSFKIDNIYINDKLINNKIIKEQNIKTPWYWIFELSWLYDWSNIYTKYGKIKLSLSDKNKSLYNNKNISINVKWSINSFKVLDIKINK